MVAAAERVGRILIKQATGRHPDRPPESHSDRPDVAPGDNPKRTVLPMHVTHYAEGGLEFDPYEVIPDRDVVADGESPSADLKPLPVWIYRNSTESPLAIESMEPVASKHS